MTPLTADDVAAQTGVSRETLATLERFVALLCEWQRAINLVSRPTLDDVWRRHVLDSLQLVPFLPPGAATIVDLGSGGGLPGLVLAAAVEADVHLVESDRRKCSFLREAARATGLERVHVHATRSEAAPAVAADVVTARALAPLPKLLDLSSKFMRPHTRCLFLKGAQAAGELTAARERWMMRVAVEQSVTAADGAILVLDDLRLAHGSHDQRDG